MQLVADTNQKTILILKGPYSPDQQTQIQGLMPASCTVVFVGNQGVDSMDALLIQFTNVPTAEFVVSPMSS